MTINKDDFIHGVDVSNYQPSWVPTSNDDFVFIKATEGESWASSSLKYQLSNARKDDLVVGFYHYMWPSKASGTPEVQVKWFLNHCVGLRDGDLLVCDWEPTKGGTPTEQDKDRFLAELKRLKPRNKIGLYVNRSMWQASNKNCGDFLWLAEYAANPTVDKWLFWQYSEKPIDQNVGYFKTKNDLLKWIKGDEEDMALSDEDIKKIAKAVWELDCVDAPVPSTTNPFWRAKSYLKNIYKRFDSLEDRLIKIERILSAKK